MIDKSDKTQRHAEVIAANSRSWLKLDYEMINAALDIEINPEMSPLRIRKCVEARLQQMSKRERQTIPLVIWTYLDALDVTDLGQFHKYNPSTPPAGSENRAGWLTVHTHGHGSASLVPRKTTPTKLMQSLRSKDRYRLWEKIHQPVVLHGPDRVIITAPILEDLTPEYISKVFASF